MSTTPRITPQQIGTDRDQAIGHIETMLGSDGSRALAEALYERLTAAGHLRYSAAAQAYTLDPIADRDWLRLLEEADATLLAITPADAYVVEHRRGDLSAVVAVSVRAGSEDAGEVWLNVGIPPESEGTVRALGGPDVMGAEVYRSVWPYGDSWDMWVPAALTDRSSGDILNAEVRRAALRAWLEHECDEACD